MSSLSKLYLVDCADTSERHSLGEYAGKVSNNWPRMLNDSEATPTPVDLYRSVLSSAESRSMTLISLGFLTNLAALMESPPDNLSSLTGRALISAKVKELVVMGGTVSFRLGVQFRRQ